MAGPKSPVPKEPMALALRGAVLTPRADGSTQFERDGLVLADAAGVLRHVGPFRPGAYAGPVQDVRPGLVVPGFVDVHAHFPQTRIIGCATGPLLDWLATSVFPEEARFARAAYARAVAAEMIERLVEAGTTTVALFSSSSARATEVLFDALATAGLRAMVGLTLMDLRCPAELRVPRDAAMAASRRLVRRWHGHDGGRLRFAVTPRFALSCSRRMLEAAGSFASEHDLPVQTHVAENAREGVATRKAHPYASSYLDVYARAGLLGPRTVLAHAIHLDGDDLARLADTGARVAHCPDSNFFLGSGRMRLAPMRERGVPVGLGSDVAAGRSFSIRRAMASAYDNALAVGVPATPAELFRLATLGGADVLGVAEQVGSLEAGKDADVVVVPLRRTPDTLEAALASLIFDNDDVRVSASYVRGRRLR